MNNTYALATSRATADATGVQARCRTTPRWRNAIRLPAADLCRIRDQLPPGRFPRNGCDLRFRRRPRGRRESCRPASSIRPPPTVSQCKFGEVFTTDGRIAGLEPRGGRRRPAVLPTLQPAADVMRSPIAEQDPQMAEMTAPISAALTNEAITELNAGRRRRQGSGGRGPAVAGGPGVRDGGGLTRPSAGSGTALVHQFAHPWEHLTRQVPQGRLVGGPAEDERVEAGDRARARTVRGGRFSTSRTSIPSPMLRTRRMRDGSRPAAVAALLIAALAEAIPSASM